VIIQAITMASETPASRESSLAAEPPQPGHENEHGDDNDSAFETTEGTATPRGSRMDSEEMDEDTEHEDAISIYFGQSHYQDTFVKGLHLTRRTTQEQTVKIHMTVPRLQATW